MMMSDPLLVLGAGEDQLPIYREAARRGVRTIAVDARDDRPAIAVADEFLHISTRDHAAIIQSLDRRRLAGVVTAASDACLASVVHVAQRFSLPSSVTATAAMASMDKATFRRLMSAGGVATPAWIAGRSGAALLHSARRIGFPQVVKPTDASGSRGASLVSSSTGLEQAIGLAANESYAGTVIVDEYIKGRDLTVEVFMLGGEPRVVAISEKQLSSQTGFVICGHLCPADLTTREEGEIRDLAVAVAGLMQVTDGPVNIDIILTSKRGPVLLEAGARLCGNGFPKLLEAMLGVDTVAAVVALAVGDRVELSPRSSRCGVLQVLASTMTVPATVVSVSGFSAARAVPGVVFAESFVEPGDTAQPFTCSANKTGYLGAVGDSRATALSTLRTAADRIDIALRPSVDASA